MISRISRVWDQPRALRRAVALFALTAIGQGIVFALLVPVLQALLAEPADYRMALRWLAVLAAAAVGYGIALWASTTAGHKLRVRIGQDLQHRLGEHVGRLPLGWFTPRHIGGLARTITESTMLVALAPTRLLGPLISALLTPATVVAVTFWLDWRMAVAFLVTVVVALVVFRWTAATQRAVSRRLDDAAADAAGRVMEFAQAQAVLRSSGQIANGYAALERALRGQHATRLALLGSGIAPITTYLFVVQLGFLAVLLLGTRLVLGGNIGVAEVVALLALATPVVEPLALLGVLSGLFWVIDNALDRVEEVLRAQPLPEPATARILPRRVDIEFDRVWFRYGAVPVLREVSFRAPAWGMTALVGLSGAGKTTIVRLITRFWDVDGGAIRVGGVDIRDLPARDLMALIAVVFQEVYLFDGSIEENVRLGRPEATDAQFRAATAAARLDEVVARLPEGWDTRVGAGGQRLSGGERQRVSIGRALLKDAPIVLLDEVTAQLDAGNEAAVQDALDALVADRTVIVVAHRLATVIAADQIVVLDHGRVVETGRHERLLRANDDYARFWAQRQQAASWRLARR